MRPAYAGRMNIAHLHLIVNHMPLFGLLAGIVLLVWGVMRNSPEVRLVARLTFVLAAAGGVVAFFTGKGAEDAVENLPQVFEQLIERHEDAATFALFGLGVTGLLAAAGIALHRASDGAKRVALGALFAASLFTLAFTGYAANLGGQISHPEIRSAANTAQK